MSITPVPDEDGRCCQLVGVVHDLTKEKQVEKALRISNERLAYALKATTDAIYDWTISDDSLHWGEGFENLFGFQLTQNPTPFSDWADYVHPDDSPRVVAGLIHKPLDSKEIRAIQSLFELLTMSPATAEWVLKGILKHESRFWCRSGFRVLEYVRKLLQNKKTAPVSSFYKPLSRFKSSLGSEPRKG